MNAHRGKLVSGGRLQVPAEMRRELGLSDGDAVVLRVVDGELHVRPLRDVIRSVQERFARYRPETGRLSDELIAERRAESEHE